jgi:hypothetical protein
VRSVLHWSSLRTFAFVAKRTETARHTRKDEAMISTTTIHTDRSRALRAVSSAATGLSTMGSWRGGPVLTAPCGTTGLGEFATATPVTSTNHPAGAFEQAIKRPPRHLGTRST